MKTQMETLSRLFTYSFFSALLLLMNPAMAQSAKPTSPQAPTEGAASNFSGNVRITTLVGPNTQTDCIVSEVTFDPKARTVWHTHPNGQLLVATHGTGYYQEKGHTIQVLREGQSVTIAPQVEHWHGAGPTGQFTHIAINPNVSKGGAVNWLQAVTDEEYNAAR
jgi:quercetin dioxygenase-like cupin family protein